MEGEEDVAGDAEEEEDVFASLQSLKDPEMAGTTLAALGVVTPGGVRARDAGNFHEVTIDVRPTSKTCAFVPIIAASVLYKMMVDFGFSRHKYKLRIVAGSLEDGAATEKQINDKERLAAAFENPTIIQMVRRSAAEEG